MPSSAEEPELPVSEYAWSHGDADHHTFYGDKPNCAVRVPMALIRALAKDHTPATVGTGSSGYVVDTEWERTNG